MDGLMVGMLTEGQYPCTHTTASTSLHLMGLLFYLCISGGDLTEASVRSMIRVLVECFQIK